MYSVNAPVPDGVARLAAGLASQLYGADVRTRHTLVCKRLPDEPPLRRTVARVRETLADAGAAPCAARIARVECFQQPAAGPGPVAYLAVESQGIERVHDALCASFDPVEDVEGEAYVPHVTVARGGDAGDLCGRDVAPVTWTVDRLEVWDATHREVVESMSLPA